MGIAMKLLYKTTLTYILSTLFILMIGCGVLFILLRKEVGDEMNEQLALQAQEITGHLEENPNYKFPSANVSWSEGNTTTVDTYGDTLVYDGIQKKYEEYRFLTTIKNIGDKRAAITVMVSHIGWDRYLKSISYTFFLIAIVLAFSGMVFNYLSNKKIWKPFFKNLEALKSYSVTTPNPLQLTASEITEFKELKQALEDLTQRSRKDYGALREFTENASHEIQTPLAIVQSKLDRISQLNLDEEMAGYIAQSQSAIDRLSKINKSLLLLAKLDNDSFIQLQTIALDQVLEQHLEQTEPIFSNKEIAIDKDIQPVQLQVNVYLCEVLVSNLLSNAFRYTDQGGKLFVRLTGQQLEISNTGTALDFPEEYLFDRFKKGSANQSSNGLGLAIVKEICMLNKWTINYHYQHNQHHFIIRFN
jgi:signal transduction histidine kinase